MELEFVILSEVGQTKKDKYHMVSFIYGIFTKWKQTQKTNFWLSKGKGMWEG